MGWEDPLEKENGNPLQLTKSLPAVHETGVQFRGPEDPLEKDMATHSSILDWKIPWTEGPSGLYSSRTTTSILA